MVEKSRMIGKKKTIKQKEELSLLKNEIVWLVLFGIQKEKQKTNST